LSEEWKKHHFSTLDIGCGFILDPVSRLAWELLDANTALTAAIEAGEDTQGRSKGRLLTPTETVNRAFAMALLNEFNGQQAQIVEDAKYKLMRDQMKAKT